MNFLEPAFRSVDAQLPLGSRFLRYAINLSRNVLYCTLLEGEVKLRVVESFLFPLIFGSLYLGFSFEGRLVSQTLLST